MQHHDGVSGLVGDVRLLEDRVKRWDFQLLDRVPCGIAVGLDPQYVPFFLLEGVQLESATASYFDELAAAWVQFAEQRSRPGHIGELDLLLLVSLRKALGEIELAVLRHQHSVARSVSRVRVHQTASGALHDPADLRRAGWINDPELIVAADIARNGDSGGHGVDRRKLPAAQPRSASLGARMSFAPPGSVGGTLGTELLLRRLLAAFGVAAGAALIGVATARGYGEPLLVAAILLSLAWMARAHLPYLLPAALLILAMNGVPGLDMEKYVVPGSFRPEDVFVIALIAYAAGQMLLEPRRRLSRLQRYLWIWSPIFLLVWLVAFAQGMDAGASALKASLYGRDFLYFAILAPLSGYIFVNSEHSRRFLFIVGGWTGVYCGLLLLAHLDAIDPSVVNPHQVRTFGPIVRIYTPMISLAVVTFTVAFAFVLLQSGRQRLWAALVAALAGSACVLALSRALYFGLLIGILIGVSIWSLRNGETGRRIRRRMSVAVVGATVAAAGTLALFPGLLQSETVTTVSERAGASVASLTEERPRSVSTFKEREYVTDQLRDRLGGNWPLGLGFAPPSATYVVGVPHGSIRNPDLGVLNGVITMGMVGAFLVYVPAILMLITLLGMNGRTDPAWTFAPLGISIWTLAAIASSLTQVTLFSTTGLVMTALLLGFVGRLVVWGGLSGRQGPTGQVGAR